MSISERLLADMKQAMKAKDARRLGCVRMLRSRLQERQVALRGKHGTDYKLTDEQALEVVATYAKQRKDSIDSFREGGRDDLAANEQAELGIVTEYLPRQLSDGELLDVVRAAIGETGAESMKDLGAVMKIVMPGTRGRADGKRVNQMVRELLE